MNDELETTRPTDLKAIIQLLILATVTSIAVYLCYGILRPFIPVLSWAVALVVVTFPVYRKLQNLFARNALPALVAVLILGSLILGTTTWVVHEVVLALGEGIQTVARNLQEGQWEQFLENNPRLRDLLVWMDAHFQLRQALQGTLDSVTQWAGRILAASLWSIAGFLLVLFTCFFLFRDTAPLLMDIRGLIPLSRSETEEIFRRVTDTIYATLYGTVLVAALQGVLGGLIFWVLELPAPVVWGVIMGLLAMVPYLGAFMVWIPVAGTLALSGRWTDALLLVGWGSLVIGLSDNIIYPLLVGRKMRFHTLIVFFFLLGGVVLFGPSGIVLGPVVLAITDALFEIWRRRVFAPRSHREALTGER
jgi:predicted PurR-regulated permease PerM